MQSKIQAHEKIYNSYVRIFLHICGLSWQSSHKKREAWDLEGTFSKLYTGGTLINPINE